MLTHVDLQMTPSDAVRTANRQAAKGALEWRVRQLAARIVARSRNVRRNGPVLIARWIRANILYTQEAPGYELLQGPLTTLTIRTGDCDDLAILWASLCRSIGLKAYVVGVRARGAPSFRHAVGLYEGQLYELSRDETYGGPVRGPLMNGLDVGEEGFYYDPEAQRDGSVQMDGKRSRQDDAGSRASMVANTLARAGVELPDDVLPGRSRDAILLAARTSGAASSGLAIAATLGASNPVGAVIAAAFAAGVLGASIAKTHKMRRRAYDRGNETLEALQAIARICDPPSDAAYRMLWVRLVECVPRVTDTYGLRGRRSRRVRIATTQDIRARPALWSDGSDGTKMGVFEVFRGSSSGASRMAEVMTSHRNFARALLIGLSRLSLPERRRAVAIILQQGLGTRGMNGLSWLGSPTIARVGGRDLTHYALPVAAVVGVGLLAMALK